MTVCPAASMYRGRGPAELEAAERAETADVIAIVDRRVVAGKAPRPARLNTWRPERVGPLEKREVLAQVEFRVRILERAEHFLEIGLDEIPFGGHEVAVALVLGQRQPEAVQGKIAIEDSLKDRKRGIDRIGDANALAFIGYRGRKVGGKLVSEGNAAAQPLVGIFGVDAVVIEAAQAQAHLGIEHVGVLEGHAVLLGGLRAGHGGDARHGLNAERCPAPRKAVPLRMSSQLVGQRVQSKFCSSKVSEPTRPASELIPTPNCKRSARPATSPDRLHSAPAPAPQARRAAPAFAD